MERTNAWLGYSEEQLSELERINNLYKSCLDEGKTERECVKAAVRIAKEKGYRDLNDIISSGDSLKPGDKVYAICMGKSILLFHIGRKPLEEGMNILGAHIDSPRIDVKQNPLYESEELAYLDTHYYGGIKKYQWVTLPLALHGVVVKKDGTTVDICVGEREEDPVFAVTDLLVHLAGKQMEKKASIVIEGEKLDLLVGSRPLSGENGEEAENEKAGKEAVKKQIMKLLHEAYDIEEEDFCSAELEIVPAGRARDCGFDRSMIMAYGQDDRVCAFTSLFAMMDVSDLDKTACCILVDKEEIGSVGATGMHSRFFENTVAEVLALKEGESELKLRRALQNSKMLSSDVSAAYDPMYAEVFEKRSSAFFAKGLVFNKFTGSRGKSGSNDANAEYLAQIRRAMDNQEVAYQFAELGKVDAGGGGTIAYIMANYGMEVIDSGVAVLCMHAPWEITSKADVYEAYKGYKAFIQEL
ncbi:aminopeptidase [Faecalicatena contorta]|uniref:M18 family aminopeptidase n=1 Tax=Faecalicatena fissicatena TaxID=290055 RepID=A0ABS2EBB9_9FIRM|nr:MULTISPECIES: aminopeptidase [Clostridia]MBM6686741.1 aminopeptidase [Faecalicatena contorta]MBM6711982.1 aminopeptidase [Faecalicatena contorta]MBM6738931.1 aminopeptidase [Faecalicatena fissicatena]